MTSATPKPRAGEHTKGPWVRVANVVDIPGNDLDRQSLHLNLEANARRIVACVNLLEGIPTEQIESDWKQGWEPYGAAKHFESERDALRERERELVEALSVIAGEPRQDDTYVGMDKVGIARAALAKHGR
jgi:hypothetical protein